ncbi:MAG: B12-binding domain-containing radical SAM protein [Desulfobacterales bacterium]|nr:B12-binding domain-containing radical SAM protein [Desulfobacterales bacterium]
MTIKILFIEARYFDSLKLPTDENLSLYMLATFLKDSMPYVDFEFDFAYSHNYLDYVGRKMYDLCGIYSTTQSWNQACEVAATMHEFGVVTIVGGPHITSVPQSLGRYFSAGCIGPGEFVLKRIVEIYLHSKQLPASELSQISGVAFYDGDEVRINKPSNQRITIDYLPSPYKYYLQPNKIRANLLSSLGCPHNCFFCSAKVINPVLRLYSAEHIVEEMEYLYKEYEIKNFKFIDDNFLASRRRLEDLIRLLESKKMIGNIMVSCTSSSKFVQNETVDMLKLLRAQYVAIGFESGAESVLERLKRGRISLQDHERALRLLNAKGIKISGTFILGAPDETIDDINKTMRFIRRNNIHNVAAYLIKPLPGTQFWNELLLSGKIDPKKIDYQELALTHYDPKWYFNEKVPFSVTVRYLKAINRIGTYRTIRYNLTNKLLYQAGYKQFMLLIDDLKRRIYPVSKKSGIVS